MPAFRARCVTCDLHPPCAILTTCEHACVCCVRIMCVQMGDLYRVRLVLGAGDSELLRQRRELGAMRHGGGGAKALEAVDEEGEDGGEGGGGRCGTALLLLVWWACGHSVAGGWLLLRPVRVLTRWPGQGP